MKAEQTTDIEPGEHGGSAGEATYTPGMRRRKLMSVLLGAAVTVFGAWWQLEPGWVFLFGEHTTAIVAWVVEQKSGQAAQRLDTRKAVAAAEDPTRSAVYTYMMRFTTVSGRVVTTPLNYGQVLRPLHSIGDPITVAYDPAHPERLIDAYSVRTWAFGCFFIGTGLLIFVPQLLILRAAGRPIRIDSIRELPSA